MNDSPTPPQVLPPTAFDPRQLELLREALDVERERIRSTDRKTEVFRSAIEANVASSKQQFEFRMAKLDKEQEIDRSRLALAKTIVYIGTALASALGIMLIYMMFFGSEQQSALAEKLLATIVTGIAGFGFIYAATAAFRALVGRR
jgi:hypothetical protein